MNITLLTAVRIDGEEIAANTTLDVNDALGAELVTRGDAVNNRPYVEPVPVTAQTNPVTGGIGFNGTIVDMDETPDDENTEDYPVGTLFISPAE